MAIRHARTEKPIFYERTWGYELGESTGIVNIAEIRRAPYHTKIKHSADAGELAIGDVKEFQSRDWTSRISVYDMQNERTLPSAESAICPFQSGSQEYETWQIEGLRSRTLLSSIPFQARLVIVEDLSPPVVELLGSSLSLEAVLFQRHIENMWGSRKNSLHNFYVGEADAPSSITVTIQYPRLYEVSHPSALRQADWRRECLHRAVKHLQCRQLFPVFDAVEEGKIECVAFEHITLHLSNLGGVWTGIVMFPASIKAWTEGSLSVKKKSQHQNISVRPRLRMMQARAKEFNEVTQDVDVAMWIASLRILCEDGEAVDLRNPKYLIETLFKESLEHWSTHLTHIARAVELLAAESSSSSEHPVSLEAQQQVRMVLVKGAAVISDNLDEIDLIIDALMTTTTSSSPDTEVRAGFNGVRQRFQLLKTQLGRHQPTLQHHIDKFIVEQQVRLQETQLEESRKAIQQADTIKRLTALAFVYIPIQTAASIFGMNVREFQPNPSIWQWILTTILLLIATVTAAAWHDLWPVFYRFYMNFIGSFRMCIANCLAVVGIHINVSLPSRLQSNMPPADPSWTVP